MEYPRLTILDKIHSYEKELTEWLDAGKPLRTTEQIEAIHQTCSECPHFDKVNARRGTCRWCGCQIRMRGKHVNKAAWGTTKCPDPDGPRWTKLPSDT